MIKEDFKNCTRLLHTIERQIFDADLYTQLRRAANSSKNVSAHKDKVELKIFELLDLFIRDSSLGLFESRIEVIELLYHGLQKKREILEGNQSDELCVIPKFSNKVRPFVCERLAKVLNILRFVLGYYGQFKGKLQRTIARLDAQAREKIKTLIDVSKWSVQKFA